MARKSRKNVDASMPDKNNLASSIASSVLSSASTPVYRVGGYVRLSAEDRKAKGDSIETQQAIIRAFVDEHPDLELTEIYIDNGLSGQTLNRPAFNRMIEDMESGKINCCISKDLSRLGRNAIDTGYYIEKYFPTKGIRYVAITDDYDSADPRSGGVMVNLKNMVNEHYALEIGRKIRQTKQMNIRKGKFVGRLAPYGYMKSKDDRHKLVLDPYAAPIVRTMFEMFADGKGVKAILNWLNGSGILPPKRYYHSKGITTDRDIEGNHANWNRHGLYAMLQNRVYCGDMVQGKFQTRSYVQKTVDKSDWVIVENTHEAIVSRELFDKVQAVKADSPKDRRTPTSENIFLRKVFCGHCGYSLKRRNNSKKEVKYKLACTTRHVYGVDNCVPVSICENDLKEVLLDMLAKQAEVLKLGAADTTDTTDTTDTAKNNGSVKSSMQNPKQPYEQSTEQTSLKTELRQIQAEIGKTNHFLKSLYESLVNSDITQDEYRELKTGYEAKIADLTAKEKNLRDGLVECIARETANAKAASSLDGVRVVADLTTESINRLVDKILVFEDRHIEVWFKFADEVGVSA